MLVELINDMYQFVGSNAHRDENEMNHVKMYLMGVDGSVTLAFDGDRWLVDRVSVEPEPPASDRS